MKRRNFLKSMWESAVKGVFIVIPASWMWESRLNPFRERYEPVRFAKKRDDMACQPADTYKPGCGESEGEIYAKQCPKGYKPDKPCPNGFTGKCIPASAISKRR